MHTSTLFSSDDNFHNNHDRALQAAGKQVALTAATLTSSTVSASLAGAGSLTGYAGMASTVSTLGLGPATTAIAGTLGSSATGAAATAVVTSALGGPLLAGGALLAGSGILVYGTCRTIGAIWSWLND